MEEKKTFTLRSFGALVMAASVGIPVLMWLLLALVSSSPGGCTECSLGWSTVGATFLAVPGFFVGLLLWIIGAIGQAGKK